MLSVLLLANIGTDEHNYYHVGDEAMYSNVVKQYRHRFPLVQLNAFVSKPHNHASGVTELKGMGWPKTTIESRKYFFKLILKLLFLKITRISVFSTEQERIHTFIKKQSLIHLTGGGNLTSLYGPWLYYMLWVIAVAKFETIPVIATSQTIGPYTSIFDTICTNFFLNTFKLIQIRELSDSTSMEYLRKKLPYPIKLTGLDGAESTFCISKSLADALHTSLPLKVLRSQIEKKKSNVLIGIALHEHDHSAMHTAKMRSAMRAIAKRFPSARFLLIPHIISDNGEWDLRYMKIITRDIHTSRVLLPKELTLLHYHAPEQIVKSLGAVCDVCITSRYHGLVFAMSSNTPCFSIIQNPYQFQKNFEYNRIYFGKYASFFVEDANTNKFSESIINKVSCIIEHKKLLQNFLHNRHIHLHFVNDRTTLKIYRIICSLLRSKLRYDIAQ